MPADNSAQLRASAQRRHEQARRRAFDALAVLGQDDAPVTVAGLARSAGVARSWIYTQPDLVDAIRAIEQPPRQPGSSAKGTPATDASWRQRLELAHQRIKELADENARLRKQLANVHGELRAQRTVSSKTVSTTQNA